jgi:hypothetical protein
MHLKKLHSFFIIIFLFSFFSVNIAKAQYACECEGGSRTNSASCTDCNSYCSAYGTHSCVQASTGTTGNNSGPVNLTNPLTGNQTASDIPTLPGKIINAVLGLVGYLA